MFTKKALWALLALAVMFTLVLSACQPAATPTEAPAAAPEEPTAAPEEPEEPEMPLAGEK